MNLRLVALTAALSLTASSAWAEAYKVNVHVSPMFGTELRRVGFLSGFDIKADFNLFGLPIAPQVELFGIGSSNNAQLINGALLGGAVGLRWRVLNDERGYRIMPGNPPGNLAGNLWVDAAFAFSSGPRAGFNVGVGYEISLIDGLQIGPFAKFYWLTDSILMFGVSFSLGGPNVPPKDYDADGDGLTGDDDKCPIEAEDKDGINDLDGCPDPDDAKKDVVVPPQSPAPQTQPPAETAPPATPTAPENKEPPAATTTPPPATTAPGN